MHRGMIEVQQVPDFKYILIHCGNTDAHTSGCLIVGAGALTEHGNMCLQSSARAYQRLYMLMIDAVAAGQATIEYIDNDWL